ncbi:UDP-glucose 4-epimerase GalE [Candidatus Dependentiae bacterium]|nr:UDP-glucose 4-epimerase GalE [Candidatus Dependentiae bacterium]
MKILVIGGAGYIGSHVCADLIRTGHKITVFDNMSKGDPSNIFSEEKFIKGDILNLSDLDNAMSSEHYDAIYHFAAFKAAGESMIVPEKYAVNNITGSLNILNKMTEYKIPVIIFSSSAAVYGEPEYVPVDETHKLNPENYYGYTKLAIEENIKWYSRLKGIRYGILRYFNAAGYDTENRISSIEKDCTNLIPVAMETLTGLRETLSVFGTDYKTRDGSCIRDYIHVNDLADAHIKSLEYVKSENENLLINLGQNTGTSVLEVIKSIESITGKKLNYKFSGRRAGDPATVIASNKLAFEKLKWSPKFSDIKTIIETTYNVYKKRL